MKGSERQANWLPYDTARCEGVAEVAQCKECLRRTAPGCAYRQPYIAPPAGLKTGATCTNAIQAP